MTTILKSRGRLSLRESETLAKEPVKYYEIIQWFDYDWKEEVVRENSTCYTIALFKNTDEGPTLQFVGNRPFKLDTFEVKDFWELARYGQTILQAEHEFNNKD